MSNTSVTFRFVLVLGLVLGLLGLTSFLILDKVYRLQMHDKASVVADNVEAFGRWVAKYGRVWVDRDPDSSHLRKRLVVDAGNIDRTGAVTDSWVAAHTRTLYSKNPALAQREFSEVAADAGMPAQFRMTSDNYMNPSNRPDEFELNALATIKSRGIREYQYFDQDAQLYRYARAVHHKPACIACHGSPSKAPADVIERYGRQGGFGYRAGDVAGIISVSLPMQPFTAVVTPLIGLRELALLLMAFLIPVTFMYASVLRPIRALAKLATQASTGAAEDLEIPSKSPNTRNEIFQLGLAIRRLNTSTRILLQRIAKRESTERDAR